MDRALNKHSLVSEARRIALINPTKFLGNLLLSGGLIQQLATWCQATDRQLLLVLDESFAKLTEGAFPGVQCIYYPRKALLPGAPRLAGFKAWWRCVSAIRAFNADLAFTIEEDSVCHRLTHFSGARIKVSSTVHRYHWGFDQVLDIPRSGRDANEASIWFSVRDVMQAIGVPVSGPPAYLQLPISVAPDEADRWLPTLGLHPEKPLLLIHAGASKTYKQWPVPAFASVAEAALQKGYQVALIGAGKADQAINQQLMEHLRSVMRDSNLCQDLCNRLDLVALARLMRCAHRMIGNDSGPSHLASALGVPGVVIFGPTDIEVWRPLSAQTTVLEHKYECAVDCSRHHCRSGYRCLSGISPHEAMQVLAIDSDIYSKTNA